MTMDDDPFLEIVSGIEIKFPEDVIDVTTLTNEQLLETFNDINQELFDRGEAITPRCQYARDLHSKRNAIQVEIRKRSKK